MLHGLTSKLSRRPSYIAVITNMMSSNAVRHRSGGQSPDSHQPSASLNVDDGSNANAGAATNNDKIHSRSRRRRDELLRSRKYLLVLGGALMVLGLCIVGMWASSTSIDGGRSARRADQRGRLVPTSRHNKKERGDSKTQKHRPHGIGHRKDEDFFPIPETSDPVVEIAKRHRGEVKAGAARNEDLPRLTLKNPLEEGAENWIGKSPENNGSNKSKQHSKSKEVDEDSADDDKDGDTEELSDDLATESKPVNAGERGYHIQPHVVRLRFEQLSSDVKISSDNHDTREDHEPKPNHVNVLLTKVRRLPTHESETMLSSDRYVNPYPDDDEYLDRVENVKQSKKYRRQEREPLEDQSCKPKHEWQRGAFPNCNILHEYELGQLSGMFGRALRETLKRREGEGDELVKYLAHGYWRDVWLVSKASRSFETEYDVESEFEEEITVLKTLRYKHDFTDRNYDRHRKDALASERLSNSPNVVDIFAYCSNSAIFEYGKGGDIDGQLWPYDDEKEKYYVADIKSYDKLDMAYQVSRGIADMHDIEDDNFASIAHTDITPSQFIYINGRWKLNDFNRCRFMRVYKKDNKPCGFVVGANPGKFRAPEEYEFKEENELIDVYSMGNIFYTIIAGEMPFEGEKESKAQKKVMEGKRPRIPDEVLESDDVAIQALVSATKKCWEQEPDDRPSAASIRDELKEVMDRIKKENATKYESPRES